MEKSSKSQCTKILEHLQQHRTITAAEAVELYGCYRLAARVADLRQGGYHIRTYKESRTNRDGHAVQFAVYEMEE